MVGNRTGVPAAVKNVLPPAVLAWTVPAPVMLVTEIGGAWGESNQNSLYAELLDDPDVPAASDTQNPAVSVCAWAGRPVNPATTPTTTNNAGARRIAHPSSSGDA